MASATLAVATLRPKAAPADFSPLVAARLKQHITAKTIRAKISNFGCPSGTPSGADRPWPAVSKLRKMDAEREVFRVHRRYWPFVAVAHGYGHSSDDARRW